MSRCTTSAAWELFDRGWCAYDKYVDNIFGRMDNDIEQTEWAKIDGAAIGIASLSSERLAELRRGDTYILPAWLRALPKGGRRFGIVVLALRRR